MNKKDEEKLTELEELLYPSVEREKDRPKLWAELYAGMLKEMYREIEDGYIHSENPLIRHIKKDD